VHFTFYTSYALRVILTKAGLTNVGSLSRKKCGAYPQDQNEKPNDHVLFYFCQY